MYHYRNIFYIYTIAEKFIAYSKMVLGPLKSE